MGHTRVYVRETAVDVPDHELPRVMGGQPQMRYRPAWRTEDAFAALVGLLLPVVLLFLVLVGHGALNQSHPDTSTAAVWFTMAVIGGVAGIALAVWSAPGQAFLRIGVASAVGVPIGFWWAQFLEQTYGDLGFFLLWFTPVGWLLFGVTFLVWVTLGILTLVVGNQRDSRTAADIAMSGGLGLGLASAGAAMYLLITLDRQAEMARQAHETPGVGLVLLVGVLLLAALKARRR